MLRACDKSRNRQLADGEWRMANGERKLIADAGGWRLAAKA
jgi:hypothetical protein